MAAESSVVVGPISILAPGEMTSVLLESTPVLVANVAGTFVAVADVCTHQQCLLSDGDIDGDLVICPCHGGSFDLRSGVAVDAPARRALVVYAVQVQNGQIVVSCSKVDQ